MMHTQLLENLKFQDEHPYAEPLIAAEWGLVLRFMLKPEQSIKEHRAPYSPLFIVVMKGEGIFAGADGKEVKAGPGTLIIFEPGEEHTVRALDEELVFVGFLHGSPGTQSGKITGTLVGK
ncbi:MAG: cupin domain-containing protein [candidate division WOR-3 bacterium]